MGGSFGKKEVWLHQARPVMLNRQPGGSCNNVFGSLLHFGFVCLSEMMSSYSIAQTGLNPCSDLPASTF